MTPDSSAIVAAFAPWHPLHEPAQRALRGADDLIAHAELEAYSVLTRLPPPFRIDPGTAAEYLHRRHPGARLALPTGPRADLVTRLASSRLSGGKVYDALIAMTADHHRRQLVTCDRRAISVYERVGTEYRLIER